MTQLWNGITSVRNGMLIALVGVAMAATACSSSGSGRVASTPSTSEAASSSSGTVAPSATATGSGSVKVLYAGSLVTLIEKQIGPAFKTASGYSVEGTGAGSTALVTQIKGKVHKGDVFISASPKATETLIGAANGDWVSWYGTFATSGLVLGYNPKSAFASELKTEPWYDVVTKSGFRLGTTDPASDPKGKLAAQALTETASTKKLPALSKLAADKSIVFPEETLVGRLQAGQLDAGFFYTSEAKAADIATVPLTGVDLKATYTVSILKDAPDEAGAEAFVGYLLGSDGQAVLRQDGFTLVSPAKLTGSGVPSSLEGVLHS